MGGRPAGRRAAVDDVRRNWREDIKLGASVTVDVRICEVGPRDGLQLVRQVMPTPEKLRWLAALGACGFSEIDATSFVPPQAFPQFADAAEIVPPPRAPAAGWRVGALVPNRKGAERAIAAGVQMLFCIVSASASHSMANTRRTREQQADIVAELAGLAGRMSAPR